MGDEINMKANKKFVEGEEAVSAVIGVILMVAITVAIAATVYVYVSGMLTPGSTTTPDFTFLQDKTGYKLTVTKVSETGVSWDMLNVTSSGGYSGMTIPTGTVGPGNAITGIPSGSTVTVSYDNTTLLGTWDF